MKNCKIVIVEDDKLLLENSVEILSMEGFDAKGAVSAEEFFKLLEEENADIAIVDIGLPDRSGFEVVEYLRTNTEMGIIILTARETIKDKVKGYSTGADFYFVKPVDYQELIAAIKSLHKRLNQINISSLKCDWSLINNSTCLESPNGKNINLTPKEQTFLKVVFDNKTAPIPRELLLKALDYSHCGTYGKKALDVMVVRLRKKILSVTTEPPPFKTVHSFGYSYSSDHSE